MVSVFFKKINILDRFEPFVGRDSLQRFSCLRGVGSFVIATVVL